MRIVQAIALFPPDFVGGASLVCRRLGDALVERGHTVDVFAGRATPDEPVGAVARSRVGELATWRVNVGGAFEPESAESYANPAAAAVFGDLLDAVHPDVVHLHSLQGLGAGLVDEAAERGIPTVVTMHDWWWLCPCLFRLSPERGICPRVARPDPCWGRPLDERRAVLERALERVDRVLVPSAFLRDDLRANGLAAARIDVVENGVPPPDAPPARAAGATEGPLRFLFVGGAGNRSKGLEVLLEAAASLGDRSFLLRCHAVRPDEAAPWAERLGARLECRPAFAPEAIDAAIGEADAVVIPSLMRESFSLVAREALARGRPVLTSDCGGPEEVVCDGSNGRIVRSGSAEDLAAALARWIDDPGELRRLAPMPAPRFRTPAEHAAATESIYRELLRERRARPAAAARASLAGRHILFLTGCDGAPLRYRVWHLAERLGAAGVRSRVLYHSDAGALAAARWADAVVLFRAPFSTAVAAVVAEAHRRGRPVLFAVDDLVFSQELAADAPALAHESTAQARGFAESVEAYARSARAADAFLGSTPELVDAAADLGLPGHVERNRLGRAWLARVGGAPRACAERVRLGYFSGTDTHDADLELIAEPLARVLARFPHVALVLAGPLRIPAALAPFRARIERRPLVPWSELTASLATVDVNLAPLDLSRRFNRAKSEVKYLEAASVAVPTVASPSAAFRCASDEGRTALLAGTAAEWDAALTRLIEDRDGAARLGEAARRDVLRRYAPEAALDELHEWLAEALARPPRAATPGSPVAMEAGGASSVALEPADAPYDAYQLAAERGEPLRPGAEVVQAIRCRSEGVFRIDVRVGTYGRTNRHTVHFSVLDEDGSVLGSRAVPAEQMVDRTFVAIELDEPLRGSAGRTLRLAAAAPDAAPGNEILLWRAPSARGGLEVGGRPCEGFELSYRSFAAEVTA